ncbi:hypothetical protein GDO78_016987 [Eleutherodactylus coqui]|uniref:Uncharacterized protein n=1 Tax=Eleutherodactylus coqui TaxID=57060 RepID=A0A8J6E7Q8_ELECQ|nr:hypothetical protein GDO78_016987 [Eleutherodactylus coqui]
MEKSDAEKKKKFEQPKKPEEDLLTYWMDGGDAGKYPGGGGGARAALAGEDVWRGLGNAGVKACDRSSEGLKAVEGVCAGEA